MARPAGGAERGGVRGGWDGPTCELGWMLVVWKIIIFTSDTIALLSTGLSVNDASPPPRVRRLRRSVVACDDAMAAPVEGLWPGRNCWM